MLSRIHDHLPHFLRRPRHHHRGSHAAHRGGSIVAIGNQVFAAVQHAAGFDEGAKIADKIRHGTRSLMRGFGWGATGMASEKWSRHSLGVGLKWTERTD